MKICVFVSTHDGSSNDLSQCIGGAPPQHTFEVRTIGRSKFREEIDAAVARNFEFYFIFLQGTVDDPNSDWEAICYFESLDLPSCGVRSDDDPFAEKRVTLDRSSPDISCTIIKIGQGCLALSPVSLNTNKDGNGVQVLLKKNNSAFFELVQRTAIDHFLSSESQVSMGCTIDLCVQSGGHVLATGINSRPTIFQPGSNYQNQPILHELPGGHRALIDVFIANQLLHHAPSVEILSKLSEQYTAGAANYETVLASSHVPGTMKLIVERFDFSGTVFDLACGTGIFGRALMERCRNKMVVGENSQLLGFDISPGMVEVAAKFGVYDSLQVESMEETLLNFRQHADTVDHIVCFTATQFLRPEMFSLFLVLTFTLANKSITLNIMDVPEAYNDWTVKTGYSHMHSTNHSKSFQAFGIPPGWSMKWSHREFAWKSPMTGHDIYSTYYRFERLDGGSQNIMCRTR